MSLRNLSYLLLSLTCFTGVCAASTLTVDLDPSGRYLNPLEFVDVNGNVTGYAGVIQATLDGTTVLDVFCVDLYHDVSPGTVYTYTAYNVNDPASTSFSPNIAQAAWLVVNEMPLVNAASASDQPVYGAALQLAIWDVIHDGGDGLSAGQIQQQTSVAPDANSAAAYTLASTWITASQGQSAYNAAVLMNVDGPTASQTFITAKAGTTFSLVSTPEPATMCLAGAGLLLVGLVGRRKAQRS
jgi:PEP-CTERM motif